jgi:hypothetical protein
MIERERERRREREGYMYINRERDARVVSLLMLSTNGKI